MEDLPNVDLARPYAQKKLKAICDGMSEYTYTFEEIDIKAEALDDGVVALNYTFMVDFTSQAEGKKDFFDYIHIAVYENPS